MAQENNELVSAAEVGAAALKGAKNAINDKIIEPLGNFIKPETGDMRHIPHPLDELAAKLAKAAAPKDMNPEHMPHPVDNTLLAAHEKIATIKAAGSVKGSEIAAELVVGAIIDSVKPGKKLAMADNVFDAATDVSKVRRVEGHLVDDVVPDKGLVATAGAEESKTGLAKFKEQATGLKNKALDAVENIPVLGSVVRPDFNTRIALEEHKLRPTSEDILRAKHLGKPGDIDQTQAAIKESAENLRQMAIENPDVAKQANRQLSDKQISEGILKNVDSNKLSHGTTSAGNYTPDVPPPSYKDFMPMSLKDAGHLVFLPQNPSQQRLDRYTQLLDAEYGIHAEKMKGVGVLYAQAGVITTAGSAVTAVLHDWRNDEEKNADLSKSFLHYASRGDEQGFKELVGDHKELKNAVDQYQHIKEKLTKEGGGFSDQDREALQVVAQNFAKQIGEKGPASFGEVSKANEQSQASQSERT